MYSILLCEWEFCNFIIIFLHFSSEDLPKMISIAPENHFS